MRRPTTNAAAWLLLAAAACSCASHRREEDRAVELTARSVQRLERLDSLVRVTVVEADSPEITVEWLDSPRRRVTARARRAAARRGESAATAIRAARADSTHAGARSHVAGHTRPACTSALRLWLAAALCAGIIALSCAKIRSRR